MKLSLVLFDDCCLLLHLSCGQTKQPQKICLFQNKSLLCSETQEAKDANILQRKTGKLREKYS